MYKPVYPISDEDMVIDFAHRDDMGETLGGMYHCGRPQYLAHYCEHDACDNVYSTK